MAIQTRDACGFNNGTAKITYSFDDSFTPPEVVEVRLINNGGAVRLTVQLLNWSDNSLVDTYTHNQPGGADITVNRAQLVARYGDLRMLDSFNPKDSSHGWKFPFIVSCS